MASTTLDQDFSAELKTVEWKTEANVLKAHGAAQAAQISHSREAVEGRGVVRDFTGVVCRDGRGIQGARPVHPRETRSGRDCRGIHRGPRVLREHPRQSSPPGFSNSGTRL